jgi:hypothetical protein
MLRFRQLSLLPYGLPSCWDLARRIGTALHKERRFFLYLLLVQALLIASLVMALTSPKTLDALTAEKRVRGSVVEAPIDRAGGLLLFTGAILSGIAVLSARRRWRRWDGFLLGYTGFMLFAGLEESDWLKEAGLHPRVLGYRIEAFHDLLTKVVQPFRAGTSEYALAAPVIVLAAVVAAGAVTVLLWRWATRDGLLDVGLAFLIGLGVLLGSLGMLIDADLLAKPVAIDWKAHLEEPLEAVGAACLALVALEGVVRVSTCVRR